MHHSPSLPVSPGRIRYRGWVTLSLASRHTHLHGTLPSIPPVRNRLDCSKLAARAGRSGPQPAIMKVICTAVGVYTLTQGPVVLALASGVSAQMYQKTQIRRRNSHWATITKIYSAAAAVTTGADYKNNYRGSGHIVRERQKKNCTRRLKRGLNPVEGPIPAINSAIKSLSIPSTPADRFKLLQLGCNHHQHQSSISSPHFGCTCQKKAGGR